MLHSQFRLLGTRRFLPLFLTQLLGAFNDNVFKNALVILLTYGAAERAGMNAAKLVTLAGGIFILPFLLFSAVAGQLADKFENARIVRIVKLAEILFMVLASAGFFSENITLLLVILFLMGTHSAFFGPIKYGVLPYHLHEDELIGGNALIETGTFLAILAGTVFGGLLITQAGGATLVSAAVLAMAVGGWLSSRWMPANLPAAPDLRLRFNVFVETWEIVRYSARRPEVFECIIAISWFWFVGATFLAQLPGYTKNHIHGNAAVVTLFLTLFSVGIGFGSLLCNRMLKGEIHATYVPLGALGISLFTVDLFFAGWTWRAPDGALMSVPDFLSGFAGWRIVFDLFMIAVASGVYTVPLYALLQWRSERSHRARTIAANNVMGASFMVGSAVAVLALLALGWTPAEIFLALAVANLGMGWYVCRLLPERVRRALPFLRRNDASRPPDETL